MKLKLDQALSGFRYYPFGLVQQGISSKALAFGSPENKLKYNGIEKENSFQIEIYDAQLRELDGQIGRWWQIDPKVENMEMWGPYVSNYDNPITYMDFLGDEGQNCCGWLGDIVVGFFEGAGDVLYDAMTTTAGVLNGVLHNATFGIWPKDPYREITGESAYTQEGQERYDAAATVGDNAPLPLPGKVGKAPVLAPENGPIFSTGNSVLTPPMIIPSWVNASPSGSNSSSTSSSSSSTVNGNSKKSEKAQHNYDIHDTWYGGVVKTGVSSGKISKSGTSYRGQRQASFWNRKEKTPGRYVSSITSKTAAGVGARVAALKKEQIRANEVKDQLQQDKHKRPR